MTDTERLIEEAERLAASFRDPEKRQNLHLAQTLTDLVTALRAERERAERAAKERDAARAELARLTTPRPIAEAPKDGTWIVGFWDDAPPKVVRRWAEHWRDYMGAPVAWRGLTHFLPLPVLP